MAHPFWSELLTKRSPVQSWLLLWAIVIRNLFSFISITAIAINKLVLFSKSIQYVYYWFNFIVPRHVDMSTTGSASYSQSISICLLQIQIHTLKALNMSNGRPITDSASCCQSFQCVYYRFRVALEKHLRLSLHSELLTSKTFNAFTTGQVHYGLSWLPFL